MAVLPIKQIEHTIAFKGWDAVQGTAELLTPDVSAVIDHRLIIVISERKSYLSDLWWRSLLKYPVTIEVRNGRVAVNWTSSLNNNGKRIQLFLPEELGELSLQKATIEKTLDFGSENFRSRQSAGRKWPESQKTL
ncbi:hypothetical protein NDU88_002186 [Pleurodeles waltl]|uniref:Uncharacterized protein n=1 Tax=Pleurodeles waltl TaxID=8319 RepID=A0AAV7VZX9_PLEWA|nr:hypothetical protein NDU88_002186 [Pleurodeles waltl]